MKKFIVGLIAAAFVLAGCALNRADFATEAEFQDAQARQDARVNIAQAVAASQLALWAPAPSEMDMDELTAAMAVCSAATVGAAVAGREITPTTQKWCGTVARARNNQP